MTALEVSTGEMPTATDLKALPVMPAQPSASVTSNKSHCDLIRFVHVEEQEGGGGSASGVQSGMISQAQV